MVVMSGTATVLQQFVSGLKSRNEDTRAKSAKDLQHYVTTELREVGDMHTHIVPSPRCKDPVQGCTHRPLLTGAVISRR